MQQREQTEKDIRANYPPFANVTSKNFQFAFKLRDKNRPEEWKNTEGITPLPPAEELNGTPLDAIRKFFSAESLSKLFSS